VRALLAGSLGDAVTLTLEQYRRSASEAKFERAVIDLAELLGYECWHVHDARRFWRGYPDWFCTRPGRHLWFELKREGGKLTQQQLVWQQRIIDAGGECYAWWPHDWNTIVTTLRGNEP
jgi:hypothetical protein